MVRLIGILTGSALAVAFLIVTLGVPKLAPTDEIEPDQPEQAAVPPPPWTAAPEHLPLPTNEADVPALADPSLPHPAEPQPESLAKSEPEPALPEAASEARPVAEPDAAPQPPPDPAVLEQNWFAFWSPFGSRIAAEGFVTELQRTTGLDYRVVKLKPGVYEVAFAYANDADIQEKLAQISTATGLDLAGG